MKNNKRSGLGGFLAGKGFYAALAVCLLGAVTAAWITVDRTISSVNEANDVPKPESRVISDEEYDPDESLFAAEDVAKPKEDVKIEEDKDSGKEESTFSIFKNKTSFQMPVKGEICGSHRG